jgi:hypothetical protein
MHRKSLIRFTAATVVVTCLLPVTVLARPAADSAPSLALLTRLEAAWTALWQAWVQPAGVAAKCGHIDDPDGQPQCPSHAATGPGGRPGRPEGASDTPTWWGSVGSQRAAKTRPGS